MGGTTKNPIKAVFVDMDGTLFDPQHNISAFTAGMIRKLKSASVFFIVATGRPYPDVFATMARAGLVADYIITSNGARIHRGGASPPYELLVSHDMDAADVCTLFQLPWQPTPDGEALQEGVTKKFVTNVKREGEWLTDRCLPEIRAAFDASFAYQEVDPASYTPASLQGTHSMWFRGAPEALGMLDRYIKRHMATTIRSTFSLPFILDCNMMGVDKGHALQEVCGLLGVDVSEVAAFGDGMNDQYMLELAGYPYVMGNGQQGLKDAVPRAEVIGSNAEDGVAKKLEALFFSTTA